MDKVQVVNGEYVVRPGVSLYDATFAVAKDLGGSVLGVSPNFGFIEVLTEAGKRDVRVWAK
jgi:hypothetical protein